MDGKELELAVKEAIGRDQSGRGEEGRERFIADHMAREQRLKDELAQLLRREQEIKERLLQEAAGRERRDGDHGLRELLSHPGVEGFLWGLGAAVASYLVWPAVKPRLRPALVGALSELIAISDRAVLGASRLREDFSDVVAEARERARQPVPVPAPAPGAGEGTPGAPAEGPVEHEVIALRESVAQMEARLHQVDEVRAELAELKQLLVRAIQQPEGQ